MVGDRQQPDPSRWAEDQHTVTALIRGDEAVFMALVERYHAVMLRIANIYVDDSAVAEEVAQDAWIGILEGISRFEGRSSLKTWMFRILTNRAKTRREREGRTIPFSDLASLEIERDDPAVPAGRFRPADAPRSPGGWADPPKPWEMPPEDQLLTRETLDYLRSAIQALPPGQRTILTLRDIEGWGSAEVCNVLNLSETNQRVLLHRARSKVRRALEIYFEGERSV